MLSKRMKPSSTQLEYFLLEAKNISKKAGKLLLRYQNQLDHLNIDIKKAEGVVSEADVESEKLIINELKKKFKNSSFLGEESSFNDNWDYRSDSKELKNIEYLWVIDPLDGTANFLNGIDMFAVCIGLLHYGKPILGVIHRPATNDTYFAREGGGSFLQKGTRPAFKIFNEKNNKKLKECMLATGFSSEKGKMFHKEFPIFKSMMKESRGIRRMGSAALDICFVSQGIFDGFWEYQLAPWDVVAAVAIAKEAGVSVTDCSGRVFNPFGDEIVVSRTPLISKIRKVINGNT